MHARQSVSRWVTGHQDHFLLPLHAEDKASVVSMMIIPSADIAKYDSVLWFFYILQTEKIKNVGKYDLLIWTYFVQIKTPVDSN
ncbi:MAG: hypothetical protein RLZZ76_649 [Candidatus Parcubacteria bacterium]|jgi:hypothetical protein